MVRYLLFLADRYSEILWLACFVGALSVPWLNRRGYRRFAAALIDLGIAFLCFITWIILSRFFVAMNHFPALMIMPLYFVLRDVVAPCSEEACGSIGKRLMHVRVGRHLREGIPLFENLFVRNVPFLVMAVLAMWPTSSIARFGYLGLAVVEISMAWMLPAGRRLGDLVAGTQVQVGELLDLDG